MDLHVGVADDVCQEFCGLGPHVPDVDVHDGQRRLDDAGEGVVVKGHDADVPGDAQALFQDCVHAAEGNIVVGTDDGVRQLLLAQKAFRHPQAVCPGGFPQPDILILQPPARVGQALLHPLQAQSGAQIIGLPADEGDALVSPRQEVAGCHGAGVGVAVVDPAGLAVKVRRAQDHVGKLQPGQHGGQGVGHDADMNGNGVRAAAGDDLLRDAAGGGRVRAPQDQAVAPLAQRLLQTGDDLKHVRVLKGGVGGQVCQQHHAVAGAAGKALGVGIGVVIHFPHNAADPLRRLLGNAVMSVQDLGDRRNGNARRPGHVLDGNTHIVHRLFYQYITIWGCCKIVFS